MSEAQASFEKNVLACLTDLGQRLPALTGRYRRMPVVLAMAEHFGHALRTLLERQVCDAAAARLLLERIASRALPGQGPRDGQGPPPAACRKPAAGGASH